MKLIEAYIPPDALDEVRNLLSSQGIEELVASEMAVGINGHDRLYWESPWSDFAPQIKLELAVSDERATTTAHAIFDAVSRRRAKRRVQILISRLDEVVSIETGQRGVAAL
jgi:nitrogen regulatory protein PII